MSNKTVFFTGMPRSGTTIIFEILSRHKDLAWISNYTNKLWKSPYQNYIHRLFGNLHGEKGQGQKVNFYNKWLPKPVEGYDVWENLVGSEFRNTILNRKATIKEVNVIRSFVKLIMKAEGKETFVAKFTGPPRVDFINSIFPEGKFVEIIRDPRAVVASLLNVDFWKTKNKRHGYWKGLLSNEDIEFINGSSRPEVVSTAIQWKRIYQLTRKELREVKYSYKLKYEDFTSNPSATINQLNTFLQLNATKSIEDYLLARKFENKNERYRERLSFEDIKLIENICEEEMIQEGYFN